MRAGASNGCDTSERRLQAATAQAEKFIAEVKTQIGRPVQLMDERFSSMAAGKTLTDQGMNQKDQRQIKDNIAAQIILQQYLENTNKK